MSHLWISNRAVDGEGDATSQFAPWSGELLSEYRQASPAQISDGIQRAAERFQQFSHERNYCRRDLLEAIVSRLTDRAEAFARTVALEVAKPIRDARVEVQRAIATFQLAAEEAAHFGDGEYVTLDQTPFAAGRNAVVRRFPRGLVLAITPFNFPLNLVAHKVAPAFAAGCPVILKPAPQAVLTALLLARVIAEAGAPDDVLQVLPCDGPVIEPFVADTRIRHLSFTGSAAVGWKLFALRQPATTITLELGGDGAVLIDETADISRAVARCITGAFSYAGQVCISLQRIYVVRPWFDEFVSRFIVDAQQLRLDDPLLETTDISCLISESAAVRVEEWINEAVNLGAQTRLPVVREANRMMPIVLTGVLRGTRLYGEEAFGPVCFVEPVADWCAGVAAVNDSKYGLQAGYFTRDTARLLRAFEELEVGGVIGDDIPTFRSDTYPYGGVKRSGIGREGVRAAVEELCERRVLVLPPLAGQP